MNKSPERTRLEEDKQGISPWKKWGPYLSERQWGTVREDYSENGDAWNYFSHDQARSRAYKWGEDGLAGISDDQQRLCWALVLWNGKDPILKERIFGLSNSEGNHGEDPKDYYFYLDSTPTHSYMKYLYKYPQSTFPYDQIVAVNRSRTRKDLEYELLDTGVFDEDRYFDVFVEYAKAAAEDILIRIQVFNRGPAPAELYVLPHFWFRNDWWQEPSRPLPQLKASEGNEDWQAIQASHPDLGEYFMICEGQPELLFTNNETNTQRLWREPNSVQYVKDGINDYLVNKHASAVNPGRTGTKSAASYVIQVKAGGMEEIRLRFSRHSAAEKPPFGPEWKNTFSARLKEADQFYEEITPTSLNNDQRMVMRQALAGMLWGKQFYNFDLDVWLEEHGANPMLGGTRSIRNRDWVHMNNQDIISMPDKWEYPWYAAWDLAFHTIALEMVDTEFAQKQLSLMLRDLYLHPNGQIPAYEWNFSDVNPPVHAWATLYLILEQKRLYGKQDIEFMKDTFHKLMLNFNWWVNRKDPSGNNLFNGGFLGLDNIGVFDRSSKLPTGGYLEQADGTAWMAFYCQNMFELALELSEYDKSYAEMALKFLQHFLWIAGSMDRVGIHGDELWDEEDGFFYDVLRLPDGKAIRLQVRSLVGLLPLCATSVIRAETIAQYPELAERFRSFVNKHSELVANIHPLSEPGVAGRRMLAILNEGKLRRILCRMLDEERFLSPYGIRSLSRWHLEHPYHLEIGGEEYRIQYLPAESDSGMFGGNSNWRGPVWFPMNMLIIRALLQFYRYYGDNFKIECPTGSGKMMTLFEVTMEISRRLSQIFLQDENGRRPVFGGAEKFQSDPYWRDNLLFYEYFHGDNGAGLGANHQTGWTGLAARLIQVLGYLSPQDVLKSGQQGILSLYKE